MPHFGNYNPESFGWSVGHDIVPYSYHGAAFAAGVARITVPLWNRILDAVVPHIPGGIHPGGPMVAGTWGYEDRNVRGSSSKSFHSYGIALDINAPWNPMFAGLPAPGQWVLPRNTGALVRPFGAEWGGDWSGRKDSMHIELHISPAEVAQYTGITVTTPVVNEQESEDLDMDEGTLRRIVGEVVDAKLHEIGMAVWTTKVTDDTANTLLSRASQAESALTEVRALPTAVWTKAITGDGEGQHANELLARAASR